tara:strand:- start:109 stop:372 length:264 start_codon:yes stop_codon:yes gene_type:complete
MKLDMTQIKIGTKFTKQSQIFTQDNKQCFNVFIDCVVSDIFDNDQATVLSFEVIDQHPKTINGQTIPRGGTLFTQDNLETSWLSVEY